MPIRDLPGPLRARTSPAAKRRLLEVAVLLAAAAVVGVRSAWAADERPAKEADAAVGVRTDPWQALGARAFAHIEAGRPHLALADVEAALKLRPDAPELLEIRAAADLALHREDKALADANRSLRLDPTKGALAREVLAKVASSRQATAAQTRAKAWPEIPLHRTEPLATEGSSAIEHGLAVKSYLWILALVIMAFVQYRFLGRRRPAGAEPAAGGTPARQTGRARPRSPIWFSCRCGEAYHLGADRAGKLVSCQKCGALMTAPNASKPKIFVSKYKP